MDNIEALILGSVAYIVLFLSIRYGLIEGYFYRIAKSVSTATKGDQQRGP